MKINRFLKPIVRLTNNESAPTDPLLDAQIEEFLFIHHKHNKLLKEIRKKKIIRFFKYYKIYTLRILLYLAVVVFLAWLAIIKVYQPIIIREQAKTYTREIFMANLKPFIQLKKEARARESSGNYNKIRYNDVGVPTAWGGYQFTISGFGACRKAGLDIGKIGLAFFMEHPEMQDIYFMKLLELNSKSPNLIPIINRWHMKERSGISGTITESGILMGAHLAGEQAVIDYFNKGINSTDGNGTHVSSYIEQFSGYRLN